MKNLTLIGVILLAVAFLLYYFSSNFKFIDLFEPTALMGILAGIGIGLIIGGIVGYVSKGTAVREAQHRKEYRQLQLEKEELEKQAAELAQQRSKVEPVTSSTLTKDYYKNT